MTLSQRRQYGGFTEALRALLGPSATGLSATTITRLIATWQEDPVRPHRGSGIQELSR